MYDSLIESRSGPFGGRLGVERSKMTRSIDVLARSRKRPWRKGPWRRRLLRRFGFRCFGQGSRFLSGDARGDSDDSCECEDVKTFHRAFVGLASIGPPVSSPPPPGLSPDDDPDWLPPLVDPEPPVP